MRKHVNKIVAALIASAIVAGVTKLFHARKATHAEA